MVKIFKTSAKMAGFVIMSVVLGTVLMFATYSLPTEKICENLQLSMPAYQTEGEEPFWVGGA